MILCSLKHIKISIQAFNTLKWVQKAQTMSHGTLYASQQHTSLLRFILHRLPATVSAQLLMRIGGTLCSRILYVHNCSLQDDTAF